MPFSHHSISERARARLGTLVQQKYRIDRLLGIGGMAAVYAATHRNGHRVAIKFLLDHLLEDPSIFSLFQREAYLANEVGHDGAVPVLDDDIDENGCAFLVMPLLEGETIQARWDRAEGRRLPPAEVGWFAFDVLEVLRSAHAKGIVHGDIKPDNLFITSEGHVRVLDFGIARRSASATVTLTGALGTPAFMPPEQALGERSAVGPASDLWALGASIFAMLSGEFVHRASNAAAQLAAAATRPARPFAEAAPHLPSSILRFVDASLAFRPEDRWPSAAKMQDALLGAFHDGLGTPLPTLAKRVRDEMVQELSAKRAALHPTVLSPTLASRDVPHGSSPRLVGRRAEMDELERRFGLAMLGQRQVVFVTGEPGIGKSTLVGDFADQLARRGVTIALGQCLNHHGAGEPYLPLLEALTRLGSKEEGARVRSLLGSHAPSWLAQMPSLWTRPEQGALAARGSATHERMLRELTASLEAITVDTPLVLTLEDIHWSDASTLDWIAHVARRPDPARLMVLATFRPADAAALSARLGGITAELALHGRCHEIALGPLNAEAIEAYLTERLGDGSRLPLRAEIARLLFERTGGNSLFMASIVNQLARDPSAPAHDAIRSIPHDVRRFIDWQIDELQPDDRELLTAASVIGREFATAAVAAALESDAEAVESACARLARQGVFIVDAESGAWPDGTHGGLHAFRHDLYREILEDRLSPTRRALSHARVGRRLETAWSSRVDAIAAELAEHFERGHDPVRAIPHHQRAAAKAMRRSANQEAIAHLERALVALAQIADEGERAVTEVELRVAIGAAFIAIRGFGATEVLDAYTRAEMLCERLGERTDLFQALWGQWMFRLGRSEMAAARRLCVKLLAMAATFGDAGLKLQAHHAAWATSFVRGEPAKARAHAESGLALFDPGAHRSMASTYGNHDAGCCASNFSAMALALAGDAEGARAMMDRALCAARSLDDPFSLALSLYFTSAAAQMLGDVALAASNSESCIQVATEYDLALPKAWGMGIAGWCMAERGDPSQGIALIGQGISAMQVSQSRHFLCYLLGLLADAHLKAGHPTEAMSAVEDALALAEVTGERFYDAELHRLHGELWAHPPHGDRGRAEASLRTAIAVAVQQGAKALELKAEESLRTFETWVER